MGMVNSATPIGKLMFHRMIKKADIREAIIERLHWVSCRQFSRIQADFRFRPQAATQIYRNALLMNAGFEEWSFNPIKEISHNSKVVFSLLQVRHVRALFEYMHFGV